MLGSVAAAVVPAIGVALGAPAAARFVEDGDAAGVRPAIATGWGVDCADGNFGSAERATAEASGAESCFHHAQRGPDWQPVSAAKAAMVIKLLFALRVMAMELGRLSRPPDESADESRAKLLMRRVFTNLRHGEPERLMESVCAPMHAAKTSAQSDPLRGADYRSGPAGVNVG
jgi:hypothetical protein